MSSNYGFVYVLRNDCMPGIYKIGMTTRSPEHRRAELSAPTGVPTPFELVCYGEVENAFGFECSLHGEFAKERVSDKREFFRLSDYCALEAAAMIEMRASGDGGVFVSLCVDEIRRTKQAFEAEAERAFLASSRHSCREGLLS